MKKAIYTLLLTCVSTIIFAEQGQVMNMKVTNTKGLTGTMVFYVSALGSRAEVKMNMPAGTPGFSGINITSISKKSEPGKSYMINDQTKSYTVVNNKSGDEKESKSNTTVSKIGEETVNGYNCIHSKVTTDGRVSELWTSKEIVPDYETYHQLFEASNKGRNNMAGQQKALKDAGCDGFPVKTITIDKTEGTTTMELVSAEKKNIENKLFEIPADYKEGDMMKTMMGESFDMNKIMQMTPAERDAWEKEMKSKYGK